MITLCTILNDMADKQLAGGLDIFQNPKILIVLKFYLKFQVFFLHTYTHKTLLAQHNFLDWRFRLPNNDGVSTSSLCHSR